MKITNMKERKAARLRFTGMYLIGLAIPIFIVLSSLKVRTVDRKDTGDTMNQLRKRDEALKEVNQLAIQLNELQHLRQKENYDDKRVKFENAVDAFQTTYKDTITYGSTYQLAGLLRSYHKEFLNSALPYADKIKQLRDSTANEIETLKSTVSKLTTDLETLKVEKAGLEKEIKDLGRDSKAGEKAQASLDKLVDKCGDAADILVNVSASLDEIEKQAKEITRKLLSGENMRIRDKILAEVTKVRANVEKAKRAISARV
jgi:chromosome condensin MukBEF ATPase and DNA-binding subunit MukB